MAYTVTDDEEFAAFAKRAEEEAAQQNKSGSSFTPKDYDKIEWVGLEEKAKIIRIVGGAPSSMRPGSHVNPTDAHEIFVSVVRKGKQGWIRTYGQVISVFKGMEGSAGRYHERNRP